MASKPTNLPPITAKAGSRSGGTTCHLLSTSGFALVEVLLATTIFALLVTALIGGLIYGRESSATAGRMARAVAVDEEGLEASRSIRDQNFTDLTNGNHGLSSTGSVWTFAGAQDTTDIFNRTVNISSIDANRKQVTSTVTWQHNVQRLGTINAATYLTNWQKGRGGMLVYADGGTRSDVMKYRILDPYSGVWSASANTPDVHTGTTNRAPRIIQVYASATRDENVLISKHFDNRDQFIYVQVYNRASGTWLSSPLLLAQWRDNIFSDLVVFSGTYLDNGNFMVVYNDNSKVPKSIMWNGSSWSSPASLPNLGNKPLITVVKARPGTNEVMAAFFDNGKNTSTTYFNGSTWSSYVGHANNAPSNAKRMIDFAWSPNNVATGALVYADAGNDKELNIKVWTANGSGGGSWSATADASRQASDLGAVAVAGRVGADEFVACDKDDAHPPRVICYQSDVTPTWTNPTNQILVSATDRGVQQSFDIGFESLGGDQALGVYSDGSNTPKLKRYTANTATWDATATSLPSLGGSLETIRVVPDATSNDIMFVLADTNQDLSSVVWDGENDAVYTAPLGKAFTSHGVNGSADTELWFDFAWDRF